MRFWWMMFASSLLLPALMLFAGRMMWKHGPRKINPVTGYRTKRSMKNIDTWKFANEYCGKLWWKWGRFAMLASALIQLPFMHSSEDTIGTVGVILCTAQGVLLIASFFPTESALKRTFTDDGERR